MARIITLILTVFFFHCLFENNDTYPTRWSQLQGMHGFTLDPKKLLRKYMCGLVKLYMNNQVS